MSDSEKPNFAQLAARSSWQLFLVTLFLVIFWRRLPHGVGIPIFAGLAFIPMVAGNICGLVALIGIVRVGTEKVLVPALIGTLLNGFLMFIFVTGFMAGRAAALKAQARTAAPVQPVQIAHATAANPAESAVQVGAWETRSPRGEVMTWIFSADDLTMVLPKGRSAPFPYEIDYTHEPAWLTVYSDRYGKPPMLMIVKFIANDRMMVLGSAPGSQARPLDFDNGREDILTFSKLP